MVEFNLDDLTEKAKEAGLIPSEEEGKGGGIREWIDLVKQIRALIELAPQLKQMIPGNLLGAPGQGAGQGAESGNLPANPPNPMQGFAMFIAMLGQKYGDITINELLDRLKAEYGDLKLSQVFPIKGKGKK